MGVFCWGELAKSANDTTTISQYIAAKILAHNIDPAAHGLQDYAMYNHRTDQILDHRDYSITSEKITTDQIIGKHFATDEGVGASQDGIEFDRNAISMWNEGVKKVYIPKTGDPTFQGQLTVKELRYLKLYLYTCFEYPGFFGTKNCSAISMFGRATILGSGVAHKAGYFYAATSLVDFYDDKFLEFFGKGLMQNASCYFGLGDNQEEVEEMSHIGFSNINENVGAFVRQGTGWYHKAIPNIDWNVGYIYRVEVRDSEERADFFVNGNLRAQIHMYQTSLMENMGVSGRIRSEINYQAYIAMYYLTTGLL